MSRRTGKLRERERATGTDLLFFSIFESLSNQMKLNYLISYVGPKGAPGMPEMLG